MAEICANCHAEVPQCGDLNVGRVNGREITQSICCAHCAFNPLGCRCKFGEFGVEERGPLPEFDENDFDYPDDETDVCHHGVQFCDECEWCDLEEAEESGRRPVVIGKQGKLW